MKVTYFKYWIELNGQRHRTQIVDIVKTFSSITDHDVRASFKSGDDNLFLFPSKNNVYLFVVTKDDELIKAISADTVKQVDIASKLSEDERIGFASYLYIGKNFFGMASTIHGPKVKKFMALINSILHRCGKSEHQFMCSPFTASVTPAKALKFSFKSAVRMEAKKGSPLFDMIAPIYGSPKDVQRFIVEMHPDTRSAMPQGADAVIGMAKNAGMSKLMLRAKDELSDQMLDYYLIGNGILGHTISEKKEAEICLAIASDVDNNLALHESIEAYEDDEDFVKGRLDSLRDICDVGYMVHRLVARGEQN